MIVRRANKGDYTAIAELHRDGITKGFLSMLGVPFLSRLYWAINNEPNASVIVTEENGIVCGFIAGSVNIRGLYKKILLNRWFHFIIPLARYVTDFTAIKRMAETVIYGLKTNDSIRRPKACVAELLSIAVNSNFRGKGIGGMLVKALEEFFSCNHVAEYKVVTFSLDVQSNGFYNSCKFNLAGTFTHHGNIMNEYHKELL